MGNMKILLSVTVIAMLTLSVGVAWADEGTMNDSIVDMGTVNDSIVDMGTVNDSIVDIGTVNDTIVDIGTVNDTIADMDTVNDTIVDIGPVPQVITFKWFNYGPGGDGGRIFGGLDKHFLAPMIVLSDYDDPPRIQFQQEGTGIESNPQYRAWIGMASSKSNNLAIIGKNLGIGTTSPRAKLDVRGTITTSGSNIELTKQASGNRHSYIDFHGDDIYTDFGLRVIRYNTGANAESRIQHRGTGILRLYTQESGSHIVLQPRGNVGIGTSKPEAKLDVRGTITTSGSNIELTQQASGNRYSYIDFHGDDTYTNFGLRVIRTDTGANAESIIHHRGTGILKLHTQESGSHIVLHPGGNVGIGTSNPKAKLDVKGSFSVSGTKNFLIDHPLDPEHKELVHATLEGPEAGVFYRGEAQLSGGEATVMLPDYFEALTRIEGRTVLLTPKFEGDEQVSMLAASGVTDGKFRVRMIDSTNPSQKFYWEVKAVRADVEILKVERTKTSSQ